jgi:hypothetical protein
MRFESLLWAGACLITLACGAQQGPGAGKGKKMADEIPPDVRAYLLGGDGLGRVAVIKQHPDVQQRLRQPEVQATLYRYLESQEPWKEEIPVLAMAALDQLLANPTPQGGKSVSTLAGHPNPLLRVRVYRYQMALVYPRDREGVSRVLEKMLTDEDEAVRMEGANLIRNLKLTDLMRDYLRDWVRQAHERKWNSGASYALLQELAR